MKNFAAKYYNTVKQDFTDMIENRSLNNLRPKQWISPDNNTATSFTSIG
mgnify:FL=1